MEDEDKGSQEPEKLPLLIFLEFSNYTSGPNGSKLFLSGHLPRGFGQWNLAGVCWLLQSSQQTCVSFLPFPCHWLSPPQEPGLSPSALQVGRWRSGVLCTGCTGDFSRAQSWQREVNPTLGSKALSSPFDSMWPGWASHSLRGKCLVSLSGKGGG